MRGYTKRPKCKFCKRTLFDTDFARGRAEFRFELRDTIDGVVDDEVPMHTYDCKGLRRLITPAQREAPDA
jgi:hypothetical protein